ncbi:hypothetical protein L9F63_022315, partial [Diploptera punctata]
ATFRLTSSGGFVDLNYHQLLHVHSHLTNREKGGIYVGAKPVVAHPNAHRQNAVCQLDYKLRSLPKPVTRTYHSLIMACGIMPKRRNHYTELRVDVRVLTSDTHWLDERRFVLKELNKFKKRPQEALGALRDGHEMGDFYVLPLIYFTRVESFLPEEPIGFRFILQPKKQSSGYITLYCIISIHCCFLVNRRAIAKTPADRRLRKTVALE